MINQQKLYGLLGIATKAGEIVAGSDACIDLIEKKKAKLILVAQNTSERTKNLFCEKCKEYNVPIYEVVTIENLSKAIGKANKGVIAVKEKGFAQAIEKIINGGEMIG